LLVLTGAQPAAKLSTPIPQTDLARLRSELEPQINDEIKKGHLPGFAIGIIKDGTLIYAQGFGVARLGSTSPITSKSLFHMASVTKTFVATAVMQLVDEGKIDLDAPPTEYLPYFKLADERYKSIKIRHMLSHTSGIPDTTDYHWDKPEYDDGALERFVRSISGKKLDGAPGQKFAYSNTAYEVLGDVIAKVSGQTFEDYVRDHILAPLKMNDSTLLLRSANRELLTTPHIWKSNKLEVSKVFPYNRAHSPSSSLYSSIEDMSRWAMANLNHGELDGVRILKRESASLMQQPQFPAYGKLQEAMGWFIDEDKGRRFVLHAGGDVGFESLLVLDPQDSLAVVAMTNFAADKPSHLNEFVNIAIRITLGRPSPGK
jgi:CubicO group peptidase (beta-lactamase class C family)